MSRKNSIESYMGIVSTSHEKTASRRLVGGELLAKLAAELEIGSEVPADAGVAAAAPVAEGERVPAESVIPAANPAVVAQTAGVADPQVAIAGGSLEEAAAGEMPAAVKPNQGVVISAGDGAATDANNFNREPEAVAVAAVNESEEGLPTAGEAEKVGQLMARSFHKELQKIASDQEYSEAVAYLSANGLLDNYKFKDGMQKTASVETQTNGLEKIASNANLSRTDIVAAARELAEIEKNAADAEAYGRQQAHEYIAAQQEEAATMKKLSSDKEVMAAVAVLKSRGLLTA
jgi:hypothetical protein